MLEYTPDNRESFIILCCVLIQIISAPLAACPYNYDCTSTRREKCMEYLRYDVVQPAKEPHIKTTGVTKQESAGMPYHIWSLVPYKA